VISETKNATPTVCMASIRISGRDDLQGYNLWVIRSIPEGWPGCSGIMGLNGSETYVE